MDTLNRIDTLAEAGANHPSVAIIEDLFAALRRIPPQDMLEALRGDLADFFLSIDRVQGLMKRNNLTPERVLEQVKNNFIQAVKVGALQQTVRNLERKAHESSRRSEKLNGYLQRIRQHLDPHTRHASSPVNSAKDVSVELSRLKGIVTLAGATRLAIARELVAAGFSPELALYDPVACIRWLAGGEAPSGLLTDGDDTRTYIPFRTALPDSLHDAALRTVLEHTPKGPT